MLNMLILPALLLVIHRWIVALSEAMQWLAFATFYMKRLSGTKGRSVPFCHILVLKYLVDQQYTRRICSLSRPNTPDLFPTGRLHSLSSTTADAVM